MKTLKKVMSYILLPFDWFSNFVFITVLRGEENNESNNDNR